MQICSDEEEIQLQAQQESSCEIPLECSIGNSSISGNNKADTGCSTDVCLYDSTKWNLSTVFHTFPVAYGTPYM